MVEIVRVSKQGILLEIREVSDRYRDEPYPWKEPRNYGRSSKV